MEPTSLGSALFRSRSGSVEFQEFLLTLLRPKNADRWRFDESGSNADAECDRKLSDKLPLSLDIVKG